MKQKTILSFPHDEDYERDLNLALDRIHHEDVLIDNRFNWLLTSQTIFVAAYAIPLQLSQSDSSPEIQKIFLLIPFMAILIWLMNYLGLLGALLSIYRYCRWLNQDHEQHSSHSQNWILGSSTTHLMGQQVAFFSPLVFMWFWLQTLMKNIFLPIVPNIIRLVIVLLVAILWAWSYPYPLFRRSKTSKAANQAAKPKRQGRRA